MRFEHFFSGRLFHLQLVVVSVLSLLVHLLFCVVLCFGRFFVYPKTVRQSLFEEGLLGCFINLFLHVTEDSFSMNF